jgi:RNA polymerase sigma-70 factor (ECF subfamily)
VARPPEKPSIPLKKAPAGGYGVDVETQVTQLMTATKGGDDAAFDQLTRTLRVRAFSVARSLVGSHDDALDLTQEAFLKTYRARATYRENDPFLPWFHRILRNTCFSFLRKKNRIRTHSLTVERGEDETEWEIADEEVAVSIGLERGDVHVVFWEGFRRLTARDREILTLRHFQELAYREIAQALEIPEGTVMSRLYHARRKLRDLLSPHLKSALQDYAPAIRSGQESGGDQP